ncbi:GTPase [Oleiphilus messinensis]|uniref:GTPase n=1 Tax=Oleiphilus messinensis TaxID=141451 RepID=A0A1Y0IBG4_9GAMM|nr:DUF697 domain-containing protein [Oleiphilus messinensis]ARU56733.1 GTPase [Oleiphilus messinensis]
MTATAKEENTEVQDVDLEHRLEMARSTSKNYVLGAMGVGMIPIPIVDLAGLTVLQLKMLHSLSKMYGVKFSKDIGKSLIASLIGGAAPAPLGISLASLTKSIPIVGTIVGSAGVAVVAGASTYALSRVFIQHFESGGNFLNFDPEAVRAFYEDEFEKGKAYAENLKKDAGAKGGAKVA